jgi:hypothetical protein
MQIKEFQDKANTLISQLEALINTMPHKGDTAATSQKIALLNDLKQVQMSVTGTEQKDLVKVFTRQVSDDPDPDAESEIIRVFDENDEVVFSKSLCYLPQIFDGEEMDIQLLKDYLVFEEGLMSINDILEGITRRTVLALANDLGIPVEERSIDRSELYIADEAFFSGTGAQVAWIQKIDNRTIGDGKRGEITGKIQDLFFRVVRGNESHYDKWCTKLDVGH